MRMAPSWSMKPAEQPSQKEFSAGAAWRRPVLQSPLVCAHAGARRCPSDSKTMCASATYAHVRSARAQSPTTVHGPTRRASGGEIGEKKMRTGTFGWAKDKFFNSVFGPMGVNTPQGTPSRPRTRAYTAPNRLLGSENGWPFRRFGGGAGSGGGAPRPSRARLCAPESIGTPGSPRFPSSTNHILHCEAFREGKKMLC